MEKRVSSGVGLYSLIIALSTRSQRPRLRTQRNWGHFQMTKWSFQMTKWTKIALVVCCLALLAGILNAQSVFATLTGVITDPAQSVIPNAKVTLKNAASGDVRNTVTNAEGYYT